MQWYEFKFRASVANCALLMVLIQSFSCRFNSNWKLAMILQETPPVLTMHHIRPLFTGIYGLTMSWLKKVRAFDFYHLKCQLITSVYIWLAVLFLSIICSWLDIFLMLECAAGWFGKELYNFHQLLPLTVPKDTETCQLSTRWLYIRKVDLVVRYFRILLFLTGFRKALNSNIF